MQFDLVGADFRPSGLTGPTPRRSRRVAGLDSLRFIAALWVVQGHWRMSSAATSFPLRGLLPDRVDHVLGGGWDVVFNGTMAVAVFFLVSGFCIRWPTLGQTRLSLPRFYTQRLLRIGIPLVAIMLVVAAINRFRIGQTYYSIDNVLWSLYCEIVYYLLMPVFVLVSRWISFRWMTIGSFAVSVAILALRPHPLSPLELPLALNWLVWLPVWLTGCVLAEHVATRPAPRRISIWAYRAGAILWCAVATVLKFHSPVQVGIDWIVLPFAVFAFFWLRQEIDVFATRPPPRLLEWAGQWSYSVYLVHMIILLGLAQHPLVPVVWLNWLAEMTILMGVCYLASQVIEQPAHRLARRLARSFDPPRVMTVPSKAHASFGV